MKPTYLLFLLLGLLLYCENISNYEKKESLRNLYVFLNLPDEQKILTVCKESETTALNCLSGSEVMYISILNNFYNTTISNQNPELYCKEMINSQIGKQFSYDAKRCHFECNQNFWSTVNCSNTTELLSSYSKCLPGIWIRECSDQNFKKCLQNCFLNGTPIWFIN